MKSRSLEAVLPPLRFGRRVGKAFQLTQRFGEVRGVVLGIDDWIVPAVVDDEAWRKLVVTETATALPVHRFGNAALVFTVDDFFQARDDMRVAMFAQLYHDPAAAHFVGDCAGGAGTAERIKDNIHRLRRHIQDTLHHMGVSKTPSSPNSVF